MIKIYAMIIVLGILGSVGYGAVAYYKDSQQRIATLQENNAKLETALETSEASIEALQQDMERFAEANKKLQADLQKAEAYGDDLRNKLRQLDLVQDAIKDPEKLQGKMNGATANLWRDIEKDTGGSGDKPLPDWLQPQPVEQSAGAGNQSGDESREDSSAEGRTPEAGATD